MRSIYLQNQPIVINLNRTTQSVILVSLIYLSTEHLETQNQWIIHGSESSLFIQNSRFFLAAEYLPQSTVRICDQPGLFRHLTNIILISFCRAILIYNYTTLQTHA